jgi:hypothetical protein
VVRKNSSTSAKMTTSMGQITNTSWEIVAMFAKVVVVGVRRIVARGAQDLTNYSILNVKLRNK